MMPQFRSIDSRREKGTAAVFMFCLIALFRLYSKVEQRRVHMTYCKDKDENSNSEEDNFSDGGSDSDEENSSGKH